jgi:integrase
VTQKRGKSWQADVRLGTTRWRKLFPTESLAREAEAAVRSRLERGLPAEDSDTGVRCVTSLDECSRLTYNRYWKGTPNARSSKINADSVVRMLGGNRHPASITATDIDAMVDDLVEAGNTNGTINRKLSALNRILKYALDRGIIDRVPRMERKRESQGRVRWYTIAEEDRILGHILARRQDDFHDLVVFLLDTGCRVSEATRAEWRDVDLEGGFIRLWRTKNGRNRAVPLPDRIADLLASRAALRLAGCRPTDLVFPGWLDDSGRTNPVTRLWARTMDDLKMDEESVLHCLRHTYASRLVQAGAPLNAVQQLLGHTTPMMTQRYAHLAPDNLVAVARLLNRGHTGADYIHSRRGA